MTIILLLFKNCKNLKQITLAHVDGPKLVRICKTCQVNYALTRQTEMLKWNKNYSI